MLKKVELNTLSRPIFTELRCLVKKIKSPDLGNKILLFQYLIIQILRNFSSFRKYEH